MEHMQKTTEPSASGHGVLYSPSIADEAFEWVEAPDGDGFVKHPLPKIDRLALPLSLANKRPVAADRAEEEKIKLSARRPRRDSDTENYSDELSSQPGTSFTANVLNSGKRQILHTYLPLSFSPCPCLNPTHATLCNTFCPVFAARALSEEAIKYLL